MGLVGESGCGKSVTSLSIMRLLGGSGKIVEGEVWLGDRDLVKLPEEEMVKLRGGEMSMIFQQPTSCLNPIFRVGDQVAEVLIQHQKLSKEQAWERAVEMLARVGIPDAGRRAKSFPHEISGGQAQRVMIAMALACLPDLLIADEPTTALDVTIQAQILDLMRRMQSDLGTTILLITHDLGVIAEMADNVAVMYAGLIVEYADVQHAVRGSAAPLHRRPDGGHSGAGRRARLAGGDPRHGARPDQPAAGLQVLAALSLRQRDLHAAGPAAGRGAAWAQGALLDPQPGDQRAVGRLRKTDWRFTGEEVFVQTAPVAAGGT